MARPRRTPYIDRLAAHDIGHSFFLGEHGLHVDRRAAARGSSSDRSTSVRHHLQRPRRRAGGITLLDAIDRWIYQHGLRHMDEIELARGMVGLHGLTS